MVTIASAHNGGRLQTNLNYQSQGEFPYLNLLKTGDRWDYVTNTGPQRPDWYDTDGYPNNATLFSSFSGVGLRVRIPTQNSRPGYYCAMWDNTGTIGLGGGGGAALGSASFTGVISGTTLTVSALTGTMQPGHRVSGTGIATYTIVQRQLTGTAGAAGTYEVSVSQSLSSRAMTANGGSTSSSTGANSGYYASAIIGELLFFNIYAMGSPTDYVKNIKICHVEDVGRLLAGETFGVKFMARMREANYGVVRFLNYQDGNLTTMTNWASRKALSYFSWNARELRATFFGGTTTNSGNAYSMAAPSGWLGLTGGKPQHGQIVQGIFNVDATQSGTCSLKITGGAGGDTGVINLLDATGNALSVPGNSYPLGVATHPTSAFFCASYDQTLDAWLLSGGNVALGTYGLNNGAPFEVMFQMAAELGAHPYFISPPYALTPMTDFTTQLATYHKTNYLDNSAATWMIPRYEPPNELWNPSGGFQQTPYANIIATAYGWGNFYNQWYGKVLSTIGQAVAAVYGVTQANVKTQTKYHVICGVQTATFDAPGNIANNDVRLNSVYYITNPTSYSNMVQAGYSNTAGTAEAWRWTTHVTCANYWAPGSNAGATFDGWAAAFAGNKLQGSIAGGVLTVTRMDIDSDNPGETHYPLAVNDTIFCSEMAGGLYSGVKISSPGTGTGTTGTYNLSGASGITLVSQTIYSGRDLTAVDSYIATSASTGPFNIADVQVLYTNIKAWAKTFSITNLCGYEGGYSPDYTQIGAILWHKDVFRMAAKWAAGLNTYTRLNLNNFFGLTDGTLTAEFPSQYMLGGEFVAWSALDRDVYSVTNPPMWTALIAYGAQAPIIAYRSYTMKGI